MSEETLQTTGWQIPDMSGWAMFVGLLPTQESEGGPTLMVPWLYMTKPEFTAGPLRLSLFRDVACAKVAITFINAMHEQINKAILFAMTEAERNDETPSEEGAGQEDGPEHQS